MAKKRKKGLFRKGNVSEVVEGFVTSDAEDLPTGYLGEDGETGYVEKEDVEDDVATGYVETSDEDADEDAATGYTEVNEEDNDEDAATGYVSPDEKSVEEQEKGYTSSEEGDVVKETVHVDMSKDDSEEDATGYTDLPEEPIKPHKNEIETEPSRELASEGYDFISGTTAEVNTGTVTPYREEDYDATREFTEAEREDYIEEEAPTGPTRVAGETSEISNNTGRALRVRGSKKTTEKLVIGEIFEGNFGPLLPYIKDINVTDINWNGSQLWIDDVKHGRYLSDVKLSDDFVDAFAVRISNVVSKTFNKYEPKLEAETEELRITILHESIAPTGKPISIRKTPSLKRITFARSVLEEMYCPEPVANFLSNSVKAKQNIVICGLPGVGKTELVKYLTNYIFPKDRVITIEDTLEIHYAQINPGKDCVELKVVPDNEGTGFTYTEAIKVCLRLLPQWILLSEARSKEVQYLLEAVSTGAKCITTLHTDDVRKVPSRVVNMMGDIDNATAIEAMVYDYFNVGVQLDKKQDERTGEIMRYISQVCIYTRLDGKNETIMLYEDGELTHKPIPKAVLKYYQNKGIKDPWEYTYISDSSDGGVVYEEED